MRNQFDKGFKESHAYKKHVEPVLKRDKHRKKECFTTYIKANWINLLTLLIALITLIVTIVFGILQVIN